MWLQHSLFGPLMRDSLVGILSAWTSENFSTHALRAFASELTRRPIAG
jgi:hypothetical protein